MELIGGLGLAGLAIYFVLRPLLDHHRDERRENIDTNLEALRAERDALFRALKELELEREMGRISLDDYQAQRQAYLLGAAGLLQEIDQRSGISARSPEAKVEEICRNCGYSRRAEDRFCPRCGAPLPGPA